MRASTVVFALCALMTLAAAAGARARRTEPGKFADDEEALRQKNASAEHKATRESVRRWTWAAMAPITNKGDDYWHKGDNEPARAARVTALAADASGGAIVAGLVRGPIDLGATAIPKTEHKRGFIARVDRGGGFRMIQLAPEWMWPSALAVDRAGSIVVSYEDRKLTSMTPQGRTNWARDLPTARALALAPDGDILAAGCNWGEDSTAERLGRTPWSYEMILGDGYVARISPGGDVRWMYRMERGKDLFYRRDRPASECAHAIAPGPGGDVFVAGTYHRDIPDKKIGRHDPREMPSGGRFVARVSAEGRLRWSRLVAGAFGNVTLAATPDGALVVVAGPVTPADPGSHLLNEGLAAFDGADGKPLWVLPVRNAAARNAAQAAPDPEISGLQIVAHQAGAADFVLAGNYDAAIVAGGTPLAWTDGGVFLANVDRHGSVKSMRGVRTQTAPTPDGAHSRNLKVGPSAPALWLGATFGKDGRGTWVQTVPW